MKHFSAPLLLAAACTLAPLPVLADLALATARNCMSCHNVDRKVVGPAFKDVATKYRGDKAAPARLATKVMQGGGGVWGVVKMPSNPQVNEAEAKKLVAWILSQ
ncbi:cytochrome C' [Rhodoferax lacus]|uniref:Cytochrome C n=1 Tax=Rhodoferax lacus TaxID=2184758 RepID=A0A3E1RH92_9BURK|nr:c-type cytochrome [Rhodoferax lacus]RFO98392.1 cytochrome C' [Rhodoferax lacus]